MILKVEHSGEGREINRHNFSILEIEKSLEKQVVQRLLKLIRFRNDYDAFQGTFKVLDSADEEIYLIWENDDKYCTLFIDLKTNISLIDYLDENGRKAQYII